MKIYSLLAILILLSVSCSTHQRSNIQSEEEFVVELKQPKTRGLVSAALQGLFAGAKYLADKSTASLSSSYRQSISINDYYNTDLGYVEKTYAQIHIKKYSKPVKKEEEQKIKEVLTQELASNSSSRGTSFVLKDVIREDKKDLLNFHAVIEIESDKENPGVSRLKFSELYVFFSKTKVYADVDLNALVSIKIEGQWRGADGAPHQKVLIEQNYDFKKLTYGAENQIKKPIESPWYYDIPAYSDQDKANKFGVLLVTVELKEYEGSKSKYVNKIPSLLNDNKKSIIDGGTSALEKILD